jgi:hypothetical protein
VSIHSGIANAGQRLWARVVGFRARRSSAVCAMQIWPTQDARPEALWALTRLGYIERRVLVYDCIDTTKQAAGRNGVRRSSNIGDTPCAVSALLTNLNRGYPHAKGVTSASLRHAGKPRRGGRTDVGCADCFARSGRSGGRQPRCGRAESVTRPRRLNRAPAAHQSPGYSLPAPSDAGPGARTLAMGPVSH